MKDTELSGTTFGRWVEEKRLRAGLSQDEAATRAEITRQQWNRIENGSSTKRDTVKRIALHPRILDYDRRQALEFPAMIATVQA